MRICPIDREWIHTYLLAPYLQGVEMMNRAWSGVNFYSLTLPSLSLKERVISWLTGVVLLLPLINCIIWIAWQTFGKPVILFTSYCPEGAASSPSIAYPQPNRQASHVALPPPLQMPPAAPGEARPTELFSYNETGKNSLIRTNWKIEHHPHLIVAQQYCDEYSSVSIYKPDWTLSEFHNETIEGRKKVDIWLTDSKHMRVCIDKNNNEPPIDKIFELTESIPWIQQPTVGFKNFILSHDTEMSFYGVIPENPIKFFPFWGPKPPWLMKGIAKKVGLEEVLGQGKLMKVEVTSTWGFPYNLFKGEVWFDPATGVLRKFIDPGLLIKKSGEFVLPHP